MLIFSITVMCVLFAVSASAETICGECGKQGDNITWTFDTETKTLTLRGEGEMADYGYSYPERAPWGYTLKNVVICDGITSVGSWAFEEYKYLKSVTLPATLKRIGKCAFAYCLRLEKVEIPASVEIIEASAFSGSRIENVKISSKVKIIEERAFEECLSLKRIDVDADNPYYSSDDYGVLFNKDKTLLIQYPIGRENTEYKIPNTVKTIGINAFGSCPYIKDVKLNENLEEIKPIAFAACYRLNNLIFPESLKSIDEGAFMDCWSFKNIVLPENLEYIGPFSFGDLLALENVTVKGMNIQLDESLLCSAFFKIRSDVGVEGFVNKTFEFLICNDEEKKKLLDEEMSLCIEEEYEDFKYIGTIRCHAGSTAEAYAKENGVNYELIHFFGDWSYDWDNLVRSHECSICGLIATEALEKTENSGIEIIEPVDPDTEFIVEEITKNDDKYVVVEKCLNENLESKYRILKTFDITLQNNYGVHVQPDGVVKVKLPFGWDKDGNYKVYRVNEDGTLTDMNAYREGSHMVFETDHFSVYVIVDESPAESGKTEENDSPLRVIADIIRMFKELLCRIIAFFQSIGDMT